MYKTYYNGMKLPSKTNCEAYKRVNSLIKGFIQKNNHRYVPLGPDYRNSTPSKIAELLQFYRMSKNFEEVTKAGAKQRKDSTIATMVDYDMHGITHFNPGSAKDLSVDIKYQLYNIRNNILEDLRHYHFDVSSLEFPSGETFVSARGDISLYAKLRDRSQLTCTAECVDLFSRVAYNTPMLKYAIRRHFGQKCREMNVKPDLNKAFWLNRLNGLSHYKAAYAVFRKMVEFVVTIVPGARITTVPKELEKDRVIECDPMCNMIVQRTIACSLKNMIAKRFKVTLDDNQLAHRLLIQDLDNVTIDCKNASNSVFLAVVEWFFGDTVFMRLLKQARCGTVIIDGSCKYRLNMLSPMGNGFTFEVMTFLLLSICRYFDSASTVFGDDIIVHRDVGPQVVELLRVIGFQTNEKKTFLEGYFRESCGGFTYFGEYITSFDFTWADNNVDAIVLINKVGILSREKRIPHDWREELLGLHRELIECFPAVVLRFCTFSGHYSHLKIKQELDTFRREGTKCNHTTGSSSYLSNPLTSLGEGIFLERAIVLRLRKQCSDVKRNYKKFLSSNADLQLTGDFGSEHFCPVLIPVIRSKCYRTKSGRKLKPVDNVSRLFAWYYLWAGKVQSPNLRETVVSTEWLYSFSATA